MTVWIYIWQKRSIFAGRFLLLWFDHVRVSRGRTLVDEMSEASPSRITDVMQQRSPRSLSWPEVLVALRACAGEEVLIRDGKMTAPAASVHSRQSAKGTELCLFPGEKAVKRLELIGQLEMLARGGGRRFMTSARARISGSNLIVESLTDENVDSVLFAVVKTRRPKLGFNQSQQTGDTTTFRNKRIKNG